MSGFFFNPRPVRSGAHLWWDPDQDGDFEALRGLVTYQLDRPWTGAPRRFLGRVVLSERVAFVYVL